MEKTKGKRKPKTSKRSRGNIRKEVRKALAYQGSESFRVYTGVPIIPKPIHSEFRTRQMVGSFADSTAVTNASGVFGPTIAQNGITAIYGAIAFELADLDQVTSLTAVFDQYRIDKVCLTIRSRNVATMLAAASAANSGQPSIFVVFDRDDSTVLTSLAAAREYDNCTEFQGEQSCTAMIEPSVTPAYYASGAFDGYGVARTGVWLDAANTGIPHYGIKFAITALNASVTDSWVWDIEAYYYVSFRNTR